MVMSFVAFDFVCASSGGLCVVTVDVCCVLWLRVVVVCLWSGV